MNLLRVAAGSALALAGALACGSLGAQPASAPVPPSTAAASADAPATAQGLDTGAERQRIRQERARIEATRSRQEAECRQRFAVTDCLNRVRDQWREPLADLRRQEVAVGDIERRERSARQQQRADEKLSPEAQASRAARQQQALEDQRQREERASRRAGGPQPGGSPRADPPQPSAPPSGEAGRTKAAAHERRVQEAQRHKQEVLQRQAARSKPAASGLPTPP